MRTKLFKVSVVLALLAILLGMPLLFAPHRIRPATFRLIQPGMTEAEVESLLGTSPGEFDGYRPQQLSFSALIPSTWSTKTWSARSGAIRVVFDARGRVVTYTTSLTAPASRWTKLIDPYVRPRNERPWTAREFEMALKKAGAATPPTQSQRPVPK